MAITNNIYFLWNNGVAYSKWDVIYGAFAGDTRYFYSTTDGNTNFNPIQGYTFTSSPNPMTGVRTDNVVRLNFRQTSPVNLKQGSVVNISGLVTNIAGTDWNYTGVVLAAGSGYIDYLNPGPNTSTSFTQGFVTAPIHPYWSTGFFWIPSWSTQVTHNQDVIVAAMGEGYSQRTNPAINANVNQWSLVYAERTDKEAGALLAFVENHGGSVPFNVPFPVGNLYNNPNVKYIAGATSHRLDSYGLNSITVPLTEVFDIG